MIPNNYYNSCQRRKGLAVMITVHNIYLQRSVLACRKKYLCHRLRMPGKFLDQELPIENSTHMDNILQFHYYQPLKSQSLNIVHI